uniref:Uncharacterized protein n=1 Tax=Leersia perrieri TaxID=77586 RepID=A0A0D9WXP2_9ORYZ
MRISVITAPKLETLGSLDCTSTFEIGTTVFQELHFDSLTTVVRTVKVFAIDDGDLSLDMIINFMRCFPCLEKLYIKSFGPSFGAGSKNLWCHKLLDPVECLDLHLKKVVLSGYDGYESHIDFITFFVLNGRVLELMMLEFLLEPNRNEKWIKRQKTCLKLENKVSRDAQFNFTCAPYRKYFGSTSRAHEMLKADPFCT